MTASGSFVQLLDLDARHSFPPFDAVQGAKLGGFSQNQLAATFAKGAFRVVAADRAKDTAFVWKLDDGGVERLATLHHGAALHAVGISADGRRVATIGEGLVELWEADGGKQVTRFRDASGRIESIVLSPDGSRVLTLTGDAVVRLWDASTGQLHARLVGHSDPVSSAVFSPDGCQVLTRSRDGMVRIFPATVEQFLSMACDVLGNHPACQPPPSSYAQPACRQLDR